MKGFKFNWFKRPAGKISAIALAAVAVLAVALSLPGNAQAHCDSYQGPVVGAARQALEAQDVKLILPYVKPDDETELTAAFNQALQVRSLSPEAKMLAENYFFETAVRLHRLGEGAAYTGLKDEAVPPAIQTADKALHSGRLNDVNKMLSEASQNGLQAKYQAVVDARQNAVKLGTVEANRERVEAELMFEKYVYDVYTLASGSAAHAEGGETH